MKNFFLCMIGAALLSGCAPENSRSGDAPVATLLGQPIPGHLSQESAGIIWETLTDLFAREKQLAVSDDEIEAFINSPVFQPSPDADDETAGAPDREMAEGWVLTWKINKALYDEYGGRISFQQYGPEPIDAYLALIMDHRDRGTFRYHDRALEAAFLNYFTNPVMAHIMAENKEEAEKIMETPFWLQPAAQ